MKKMKSLIVCVLAFGLLTTSCGQDDSVSESVELSNFNLNLEDSNLGKELILLEYESADRLQSNLNKKIEFLINDMQTEIANSNGNVSDMHVQLNIQKGKITIASFSKFNRDDNHVIEQVIYDEQSKSYNRLPIGILPDFAKCPKGFTEIESCSNVGNTSDCVADAISGFLTGAVSTIGDCAQVQVEVGTFTTKVCGKSC